MKGAFNTTRTLIGAALSCLLAGLGFLWCLDHLEMTSIEYDDHEAAQGAIGSGWLPEWLPRSATRIREAHDIDTNHSFAVFEFDPEEVFYAHCERIMSGRLLFPRPDRAREFPSFAEAGLERVQEGESLDFYRCDGTRADRGLAVDSTRGVAYIWME